MLRPHLDVNGADPALCVSRQIALGRDEQEISSSGRRAHDQCRALVAVVKKALAELLASSGLQVALRH